MAVPKSLISFVSIVIIVGAGAVWSGVGTLAVALWYGKKDTGYLSKALAVALVIL